MSKRSSVVGVSALLLLALTLFTFVFSIGVQAQDAATPVPLPTATTAVSDIGSGSTRISFWNGLTGSDGTTLNAMLSDFAAENTDLAVTTEIIPWAQLYTKLQAAFVAGQGPDVFVVHTSEVPQFASYGVLADLGSWYTDGGGTIPADDFAQPGFDAASYDGVRYGVELDNHGRGSFINVDMFEAAGLDPNVLPANYDELVVTLQQLTLDANGNNAASPDFDATNVVQWGTAIHEWTYTEWFGALSGSGGAIFSEDGTTATVNSEAGLLALQRMYDLIYTYHVSPVPAGFDTWQSFAGGFVAVLPTGTWFRNFVVDQSDINWQAWPVMPIGTERGAWFGSHVFLVPNTTTGEKLAAVRRMIEWITDNQVAWAASGQVPARISAQAALDPEAYPSNILIGQTFQEYGFMEPASTSILEIQAAIDPELNAALNNLKTPEQALNDANERVQQVLDRSGG